MIGLCYARMFNPRQWQPTGSRAVRADEQREQRQRWRAAVAASHGGQHGGGRRAAHPKPDLLRAGAGAQRALRRLPQRRQQRRRPRERRVRARAVGRRRGRRGRLAFGLLPGGRSGAVRRWRGGRAGGRGWIGWWRGGRRQRGCQRGRHGGAHAVEQLRARAGGRACGAHRNRVQSDLIGSLADAQVWTVSSARSAGR